MTDRSGIFAGDNPFEIARRWLSDATETEINDPNAMALSTVDETGLPNVRMVLLKEISDDGFWFYTNYGSAKGRELEHAGKAAIVLHWKSLRRQLRVRGRVVREDGPEAEESARGLGLEAVTAAFVAHGVDGGSGESNRSEGHKPTETLLLGRFQNRAG